MMEAVHVKNAFMEPVFGETEDDTQYRVKLHTDEGIEIEFLLSLDATNALLLYAASAAIQERAHFLGKPNG